MSALQQHPDLIGNRVAGQINLAFTHTNNGYVNLVTGDTVQTASIVEALQLAEKYNAYAEITIKHPERGIIRYPGRIDNLCRHYDTCLTIVSHAGIMHVVDEHGTLTPEMIHMQEIGLSFNSDILGTTRITAQYNEE